MQLQLMSGWELLDWLAKREMLHAVPVVIVSGSPYLERACLLHPNVVGVVEKPFRIGAVVAAVRAALARPEQPGSPVS